MTELDISAEKRVAMNLGCGVVAWDASSLVIQYRENAQRSELIKALRPLGWDYPVDDPGNDEAMIVELRRVPVQRTFAPLFMKSTLTGQVILAVFACVVIGVCMVDVQRDVAKQEWVQAVIAGATYILIVVFVLYSSLPYVTLKVWLKPQEIILTNYAVKITLRVSDIKSCVIQAYRSSGASFFSLLFTMKSGQTYKMPAPFKGFHTLKDELRKRYSFSIYP